MIKKVASALLAGLISSLGALMAVIVEMPGDAEVADIGSITLLVIVVTGCLNAAKDLQAYLKK